MTIAELREKCKAALPRDVLILSILIGASCASFGLGYLTGLDVGNSSGEDMSLKASPAAPADSTNTSTLQMGQVVASKSGTKYYLPSCAGADKIAEKNKVYFASPELARREGYTPAANCPGL